MDITNNMDLKDVLTGVSPLIKSLVDTFVTPKLVSFRDRNKEHSISDIPSEEDFTEYFHRTYKRLAVVNTLVFNNSQRLLTDIYLPLTIKSTQNDKIHTKINGFPQKLSDKFGNILITDSAGMGKSTLMKSIFLDCVHNDYGIPIFLELRRLHSGKTLIDEIKEQLNSINKSFDSQLVLNLLAEGGFILILDGYDEISLKERDVVTKDIQDFISKASNNRFFLTSRPEKALVSFGNFQEFKISPLTKKEAFELLRKYDKQGGVSSLLIKKLQEHELKNIEEFLTNPLLVSLLYLAFEHKQAIPFKKYLFYRQVYDANFESHDLTKGDSYIHDKYSGLEIDDFHRVLRHIGFSCLKLQRIEFTKDELLKLISDSKAFCLGLDFNESDFLQDILKTVPLFAQDGNYYRWVHKSLQEYFAAQFIYLDSKSKQEELLLRIYNHDNLEKFGNILDLYYDIDPRAFRNVILLNFLKEFRVYSEENFKSGFEKYNERDLKRRKELLFLNDCFLFKITDHENEDFSIRFNAMLARGREVYPMDDNTRFATFLIRSENSPISGVYYQYPKLSLINLLKNKKNPIIKITEHQGIEDIRLNPDFEKDLELIKVTSDVSNRFNSLENFEKVNRIIGFTKMTQYTIDYDVAINELDEIERNLAMENDGEQLLSGI